MVARILQAEGRGLTMIFTRTKRHADRVAEDLDFRGFAVAAVHGDLGQGARERALRAFRNGKIDVLVATDVAARGLDVSGVTHVINYDCPEDPDTYTHRIGRTGRAGATGVAVTFVDWEDMPRWRIIDKTLGLDMPGAAGDLPHLAVPLHRPGHPGRRHRHPADGRAHAGPASPPRSRRTWAAGHAPTGRAAPSAVDPGPPAPAPQLAPPVAAAGPRPPGTPRRSRPSARPAPGGGARSRRPTCCPGYPPSPRWWPTPSGSTRPATIRRPTARPAPDAPGAGGVVAPPRRARVRTGSTVGRSRTSRLLIRRPLSRPLICRPSPGRTFPW